MANWRVDLDRVAYPLHEAVINANSFKREELLAVMKMKIENGTSVNGLDSRRCTPLTLCIRLTHDIQRPLIGEVTKFLLQHKADPNIDYAGGQTTIHVAAWHGDLQFIKLCMQHGMVDLNMVDCEGRKPVDLAAIRGHTQITEYLDAHSGDLRSICRSVIRKAMGLTFNKKLQFLPLPPQVKLFLSYHIPYPGFEAVIVPPAPWTKEELWQKKPKSEEVRKFIIENASGEFLAENKSTLKEEQLDNQHEELVRLFQDMYLWESFKTVNFQEPLAPKPRYSMTKVKKPE